MEEYKNLVKMGNEADKKGDKEKAIELYKKAHLLSPNATIPLNNLSIAYYEIGNFDKAKKYAEKTLQTDANSSSAFVILGNVLYQKKQFNDALKNYLRAYEINPKGRTSLVNIANTYLELKKYDRAEHFAKMILELPEDNAQGYSILGNIYKEAGNKEKALEFLQKAVEYDCNEAWTYNYLSQIYQDMGDVDKALSVGYKAIELDVDGKNNFHHINFGYMLYETLSKDKSLVEKYAKDWFDNFGTNEVVNYMANSILNVESKLKASNEYLVNIFNIFAPDFENVLADLKYQVPEKINAFLQKKYSFFSLNKPKTLDAGCGTGLCGKYLRKYAKSNFLHGVDISPEMISVAKEKKVYDALIVNELVGFLNSCKNCYDLIVSADVFTYFGDLKNLFIGLNNALNTSGRAVFSVTENKGNESFFLHPSGRFLHSKKYVENILEETGFELENVSYEHLRNEGEKEVWGYIFSIIKKQ